MTSRHLPLALASDSSDAYIIDTKGVDLLAHRHTSEVFDQMVTRLATSAIREALRDQSCDMVPRLVGLIALPSTNKWGDNLLMEVTYAKRGWRASYGGHFDDNHRHIIWNCYAN
jgi:hypothetical protein